MNFVPRFEYELLSMLQSVHSQVSLQPLALGGTSGSAGGSGSPPGGFIGQLAQGFVTYDTTEAESLDVPSGGSSLLHNLNRVRYRIAALEAGGGGGGSRERIFFY